MPRHLNLRKSLLKYLTAAVLLVVPLYQKFPLIKVRGTFVAVRLEDFLMLSFALFCFLLLLPKLKEFISDDINRAIFLFLWVGLISLLSGILLTKTLSPQIGLLHWLRRIEYFIPFFAGILAMKLGKKNLDFYFKLLIITVVLVLVYGFGQKYFSWPIIVTQNQEYSKGIALRYIPGSHINSTFAGHYDMASYLVLVLPVIISAIFLMKGLKTKILLLVTIFFGLWLLVNAVSRISIVSYLIGVSFSLLLIKKYWAIPVVIIVSLAFMFSCGLSTNLLARYTRIIEVTKQKVLRINFVVVKQTIAATEEFSLKRTTSSPTPTPTPVFEDRSTSIRLNVEWPRAIRALAKNPFLGTGYSSITLATDNDYLRLFGEVGLIGFFAFLLILIRIGHLFFKQLPFNKNYRGTELAFAAGIIGAFPGILLNAVFIDVFEASKFAIIFWLLIGMVVQLAKDNLYDK